MRILPNTKDSPRAAGTPQSSPSAENSERLGTLEAIVRTLLQRLQSLEERVGAAASAPPSSKQTPVTIDADLIKKGLLHQMWKYMNDERHPPAA